MLQAAIALASVACLFSGLALIMSALVLSERKRRDRLHEEFGSPRGEKPEQRAERLLMTLLPKFVSRDEAMDSLYLVYPAANERNLRHSISAAIYILNDAQERKRKEQSKRFEEWTASAK